MSSFYGKYDGNSCVFISHNTGVAFLGETLFDYILCFSSFLPLRQFGAAFKQAIEPSVDVFYGR